MFGINEYFTKIDMSLELLNKRLWYQGGDQQHRFIKDKAYGLKQALLYSYQAATAIRSDGREFRCLINPDKNKPAYDNKILSIPYWNHCINFPDMGELDDDRLKTKFKCGDVFTWKETNTHWLVYLEYIEQDAYFRSQIRRCDQQIKVNDDLYWVYIRGPVETSIEWTQKRGVEWNTLNYSLVMYITADKNTNEYFQRFKKVKIIDPRYNKEKTWQVVGVDPYYGDGIIQVFLDEFFENSLEDAVAAQKKNEIKPEIDKTAAYIDGPTEVPQYSKAYYEIHNIEGGKWFINWQGEEKDLNTSNRILSLQIPIGQKTTFTLIYRVEGQEDITLDIKIIAL